MPARSNTEMPSASTGNTDTSQQKEDPAYKKKRQKNNEAVQRTREKNKKSNEDRKKRIDNLKRENAKLEGEIKAQNEVIKVMRELIMRGNQTASQDQLIDNILKSPDDDDVKFDLTAASNQND